MQILKNLGNSELDPNLNTEAELDNKLKKQQFLVDIAINQIQSRCKKTQLDETSSNLLNLVCACLVNLWLNYEDATTDPTGTLKANGYSISKNSKEQLLLAKKLFDQWRSCAAHLLVDEGFTFFAQKGLVEQ